MITPDQALRVLNEATASIKTDRQNHKLIMDSLHVLSDFVVKKNENKSEDAKSSPGVKPIEKSGLA